MPRGAEWVTPDSLSCHLLWSTLYQCRWEITAPWARRWCPPTAEVRRTREAEPEHPGRA